MILHDVIIAIPTEQKVQDSFERGYAHREEIAAAMESIGGEWVGSGFGGGCAVRPPQGRPAQRNGSSRCTISYQAFDLQIQFPDAESAKRGAEFARRWLTKHGYRVVTGNRINYDGNAYVFVDSYDPNRR